MTVAPGYVQKVWAFGGKVPGPVIRVKQGDTVRVHLKNPPSKRLADLIDFHASQAAWNDEMTSIEPGKKKNSTSGRRIMPGCGCTTAAAPIPYITWPMGCTGWLSSNRKGHSIS